jgi:hypothetical protein
MKGLQSTNLQPTAFAWTLIESPDYLRSSAVQVFPLCALCLCGEFFGLVTSLRFFAERWR